ncbi:hypothetical protein, partial [Catenibacterium sp.]|uniref:hypothetical protein n=1 Tax=Catenibacterium sp. TaxID=2049022 RepID=UPI003FD8F0BE
IYIYIYIIIMLALTFMRYYKFISYISKKVSAGDVALKYKYPLKKFNTYVTKVDTYYSSAYVTATVGDFKKLDNWTVRTK